MYLIDDDGTEIQYTWDPLRQEFVEGPKAYWDADGTSLEDGDRDLDETDELSTQLFIMQRKEAADYLDGPARELDSFENSNQLLEVFEWHETEQGYAFWEEIYHELLMYGWEDPVHPALSYHYSEVSHGK